jgi:hypothetical protein
MANPRSSFAAIYFLDTSSSSSSSSFSQHYKRLKVWSNPECACMGKSISSHELINNFDQKIMCVYFECAYFGACLPALHVQSLSFQFFDMKNSAKFSKKIRERQKSQIYTRKEKFPNFLSKQQQIYFVLKNFYSLSMDASPIDVPQEEGNRPASNTHLFYHQKLPQIMMSFSTELTSFSFFINFKTLSKG